MRRFGRRPRSVALGAGLVLLAAPLLTTSAGRAASSTERAAPAAADPGTAGELAWAGVRSSRYGIHPFPGPQGWGKAMTTMSGYFPGSTPVGVWLVGEIHFDGRNSGQRFDFPNPGGSWDHTITVRGGDRNEAYLNYFDTHGIKVFLQVEPGFSPMDQLVDITFERYGRHPSVAGFGVDVEWYRARDHCGCNAKVGDSLARAWERKVRSVNPGYRLFLKHYRADNLPPTYRGDIVFIDDSEDTGSYSGFKKEMIGFANTFYPNPVMFQLGYPSDRKWWSKVAGPIPRTIGDDLAALSRQQRVGVVWVDFSLRDVLPTS